MLRLSVVAHPGARSDRLECRADGDLHAYVRARPVEGQANAAIERLLSSSLGLKPRQVRIVGGATSKRKIVDIDLGSLADVRQLLAHGVRDA